MDKLMYKINIKIQKGTNTLVRNLLFELCGTKDLSNIYS